LHKKSPKLIPWFVSDVTPVDFKDTFKVLRDPTFFPAENGSEIEHNHLDYMISRWNFYLEKGIFSLSVPKETPLGGGTINVKVAEYWTTGRPFWDMETEAPELFTSLKGSRLVIFKASSIFIPLIQTIDYRITLGRCQVSGVYDFKNNI
jgi:damage-control phosphatase, subfamily III